jgi:hypothetical protein
VTAVRAPHAALLGTALALFAAPSAADDEPAAETTKVVVIDVGSLPAGEIPPPLGETDAPVGVPAWTQPASISVTAAGEMPRHRRGKPVMRVSKKSSITSSRVPAEKVKLVSIAPTTPSIDALYAPSADATELDAPASQKLSCGDRQSVLPMRWESLATSSSDDARLFVHDLWFDAKTCAVGPGPEATLALKAVAWEGGRPWLYAMRSHLGVTLVLPRVSEISSESMVGAPVSIRGDFTRVTMPMGRWGSGSIVAQMDAFPGEPADDRADRPIEVGIELVQTMSETAPTLLVRTRRANAPAPQQDQD